MQLSPNWLTADATQRVMRLLSGAGHQVFAVGGCVRNTLLGAPVADIDLATSAAPDVVMALADAADLRVIPTGIDHGTVTVVVGGTSFEITTYRRDVETDGRHAVVAFAETLEEDAQRRDFTINALYMDAEGRISDPVGGLADLQGPVIRFIGDADARIAEDYLRTLRFFRFFAWCADQNAGFEADSLAAIAGNLDGLEALSAERVGAEFLKLLSAPDPSRALSTMQQTGVLMRLLPGAEASGIAPLVHLEAGEVPDAIRRLAVLGDIEVARLRLSRSQQKRLADIRKAALDGEPASELSYKLGAGPARDAVLVRSALMGTELLPTLASDLASGANAKFPICADDLMPDLAGRALGEALRRLETDWIASGFTLSKAELLARL